MKITPLRIAVRRKILLENLLVSFILLYLIIFGPNHLGYHLPIDWAITLMVLQMVGVVLVTWYRLREGDDGKMIAKVYEKKRKRIQQHKAKFYNAKTGLQQETYKIISVTSSITQPFAFLITFARNLHDRALPQITINGKPLPSEKVSKQTIVCYAGKQIDCLHDTIEFMSGIFPLVVKNPYRMDLRSESIIWQNEGHKYEKKIRIDDSCFSFADPSTLYPFDLLINGKLEVQLTGRYHPEQKAVVIPIPEIRKQGCVGKECVLRVNFPKPHKVLLPLPRILTVNGEPVRMAVV